MLAPINIYLAGRATTKVGRDELKIRDMAVEGSRSWIRQNLHALDAERDVQIHELIQPGSQDLQGLFSRRGQHDVPLANDTSIGVGYAPMSPLERLVLSVEKHINARERKVEHPACGEDVKVMGVRYGDKVRLMVACALIGRHLAHIDHYLDEKASIRKLAQALASQVGFSECDVAVNAADDPAADSIYLTVTGTSAESGDDGQVGRGNRVNGLITPNRPMSLEAAAGKNPVSHVGKIYNVLARDICETLVAKTPDISAAHCLMVSQIGSPITSPAMVQVKIATADRTPDELHRQVEEVVAERVAHAPELINDFVAGRIDVF